MATYCSATDVAEFLQRNGFSGSTTPTDTTVDDLIERNEQVIEQRTNHAWRVISVVDEFIDNPVPVMGLGWAFYLKHRSLATFTNGTDTINIFDGSSNIEYVANKTEGRGDDYFVDKTNGVVYIRDRNIFYPKGNLFSYRYGETTIDLDIEKACILLTCADIISMNDKSARFVDDGPSNRLSHSDRANQWRTQANDIIERKKELTLV